MNAKATVLASIAAVVAKRLSVRKGELPLEALAAQSETARQPRPFAPALNKDISIIAEIKFKSPSEGRLNDRLSAVEVARDYIENGAAALSVLTEQDYFDGSFENLRQVRKAFPEARILMKDFIIDEYQIYEARLIGADCILLIVALLGAERTTALLTLARRLDLSVLVEVHDEQEMAAAIAAGATFIGINNRDLRTLKTSLDVSRRLSKLAPTGSILVCESGISGIAQIREFKALGFKGFLVGTSLMGALRPGLALRQLMGET